MRLFKLLVTVSTGVCPCIGVMFTMLYCLFPTASPFLTFNIPSHYLSFPIYTFHTLLFALMGFGSGSNIAQMMNYAVGYFLFIMPIFRNELKMGRPFYKTREELRHPFNLLVTWRSIEIFVVNVTDNEFGFIFIPIQAVLTLLILICNVTLVFHWNGLQLNVKMLLIFHMLTALISWTLFLHQAGKQYLLSVKVLKTWRPDVWKVKERRYMTRVKRACRPVWIGDGTRFMIRPGSVLRFLLSVAKNTFKASITYGNVYRQ